MGIAPAPPLGVVALTLSGMLVSLAAGGCCRLERSQVGEGVTWCALRTAEGGDRRIKRKNLNEMLQAAEAATPESFLVNDTSLTGSSKRTRTSNGDTSVAGGASLHTRLTGTLDQIRLSGGLSGEQSCSMHSRGHRLMVRRRALVHPCRALHHVHIGAAAASVVVADLVVRHAYCASSL